ncbi:MAG: hypothetical protein ALECFALPRED_004666 [Alectoria fallacina]|uniref:Uncharacterized protein n=1 Tax=Alectoria fallacina TaxID=1903189 RepID=A0A8H3I5W5_9LECA|nr:MAG: hypothetical protein ALECFALPRED_004666 [Alectoria fallacina]
MDDDELRDERTLSPENDIVELCRGLVVIDSGQDVFRLAHYSVREYLLSRIEYTTVELHAFATERCLDIYLAESWPGSNSPKTVKQNSLLKSYAEVYWPVHYKYIEGHESSELRRKILQFTKQESKTSLSYAEWASDISQHGDRDGRSLNKSLKLNADDRLGYRLCFASSEPRTHLSAACAFGFPSFMKDCDLSSIDWNPRQSSNGQRYTLLLIAAEEDHETVVRFLLECGADIGAEGGGYGHALRAASAGGHVQVVNILLDNEADVNAQGGRYENALQAASTGGHV